MVVTEKKLHDCCSSDGIAKLQCGHELPVVSAACKDGPHRLMPVTEGLVGSHKVSVLRDTGCSGVVIRTDLVTPDLMTGEHKHCVFLNGTVQKLPTAKVYIDTPYFIGEVEAICMSTPVYDVVVGNIKDARPPDDPQPGWHR